MKTVCYTPLYNPIPADTQAKVLAGFAGLPCEIVFTDKEIIVRSNSTYLADGVSGMINYFLFHAEA